MSIKITWTPMGGTPDTLKLYWSPTPFTYDSLPGTVIVFSNTVTEYTDVTVPANTLRYYMVEATKAGANTQYSQCLAYFNCANLGPGPTTLIRGDWNMGYFGTITSANLFTISGLRTAASATGLGTAPADNTMTLWYKFIYQGKIIYIPNNVCAVNATVTWPMIYNLGLVYGVDGTGETPFDLTATAASPAIPTLVNQKKVVTKGTDSFLVRSPKLSTLPTGTNVPDKASCIGSEWWSTMCLMVTDSMLLPADIPNLSKWKWGDIAAATWSLAATQHFVGRGNMAVANGNMSGNLPRDIVLATASSWVAWVPVLEFIYP